MRFRDRHVQDVYLYIRKASLFNGLVDEWVQEQYLNPTWGDDIYRIFAFLLATKRVYFTGHWHTPSTVRWWAVGYGPAKDIR